MRSLLRSFAKVAGSVKTLQLLAGSLAGYLVIERLGLFRYEPASFRQIFHSMPVRAISVVLAAYAVSRLLRPQKVGRRKAAGHVLLMVSLLFMVAGLWVSIWTRFEGRAVVMQGGSFTAFGPEYVPSSLYLPRLARAPEVGMYLAGFSLTPSNNGEKMERVDVDISYSGKWTRGVTRGRLSSAYPFFTDWTFVTISDFGYAPRYVLSGPGGEELESNYVALKLFPPGVEDSFTAAFYGYVFSLKCYPDGGGKAVGRGKPNVYPVNPVFGIRITRNKDIVYNGPLRPTEKLMFDNAIISMPEVKMWVELTFVRDLGYPLAGAGLAAALSAAVLLAARRQ